MEEKQSSGSSGEPDFKERRSGEDRRKGGDRRKAIRFENCRRKNHGRRAEDKDPWKDSFEFD